MRTLRNPGYLLCFFLCLELACALALRAASGFHLSTGWAAGSVAVSAGFALATVASLVATGPVRAVFLAVVLLLGWPIIHFPNMESIHAVSQPVVLDDLHYLLDRSFLIASLTGFSFPWLYLFSSAALALLWLALTLPWTPAQQDSSRPLPPLAFLASAIIVALLLSGSPSNWRETHPFLWTLGAHRGGTANPTAGITDPGPAIANEVTTETSPGRARNVLLIVLEGIPGAYIERARRHFDLPTGSPSDPARFVMPGLSRIAERGRLTPVLLTHSRQTARGLYSMLCGDYSKLLDSTLKSLEYTSLAEAERRPCLPAILDDLGYRTAFLQAAPLDFMGKDTFMPATGFESVHGVEWFPDAVRRRGWGIDDTSFFEHAVELIDQIDVGSEPWFLTLLTVGTHHPYLLDDSEADGFPSRKLAAVARLDEAVAQFWEAIRTRGVPKDTLVIFTSDESHGVAGQPYGANWGFNLMLAPDLDPGMAVGNFGLVDTPLSILDYLGKTDRGRELAGRSILRAYDDERPLLFASDRLYQAGRDGVVGCASPDRCVRYRSGNGKTFDSGYDREVIPNSREAEEIADLWRRAERADQSLHRPSALTLIEDKRFHSTVASTMTLTHGQYLEVPAEHALSVALSIRNAVDSPDMTPRLSITHARRGSVNAEGMIQEELGLDLPVTMPALAPGERFQTRFTVDAGPAGFWLMNPRLDAISLAAGGIDVVVEEFRLSWRPSPSIEAMDCSSAMRLEQPAPEPAVLTGTAVNGRCVIIPPIEPGVALQTAGGAAGVKFLLSGWSVPESWGVWSTGESASLAFNGRILDPARLHRLVLEARSFHLRDRQLDLYLNGRPLAGHVFSEADTPEIISLPVPAGTLSEGVNVLRLVIENPRSPVSLGINADTRALGIGLSRLKLDPVDASRS